MQGGFRSRLLHRGSRIIGSGPPFARYETRLVSDRPPLVRDRPPPVRDRLRLASDRSRFNRYEPGSIRYELRFGASFSHFIGSESTLVGSGPPFARYETRLVSDRPPLVRDRVRLASGRSRFIRYEPGSIRYEVRFGASFSHFTGSESTFDRSMAPRVASESRSGSSKPVP